MPVIPDKTISGKPLTLIEAFPESDRYIFNGTKHGFTATGETTVSRFAITSKQAFNGLHILVHGQERGQWMGMNIISDGTVPQFGPDGYVLNVFSPGWWIDWERSAQPATLIQYRGTLLPGMAIEFTYHKDVASADVEVYLNLFLHKDLQP